MAASISISHLTKCYEHNKPAALDDLSLEVKTGEVYGYLGSNGAGKSTTIRLLMNFLQPTSGSATIMDYDVTRDSVAVKRHVGYLSGDIALYPKVTGTELFRYLLTLQKHVSREYCDQLSGRFMAELNRPIGTLSKGNRQKIGIIQAFMHQPDVLILDEPTSGLDPLMQEAFYKTVHEAQSRGAAILMSSHNLNETQELCDRIGIIKHGKLIREQDLRKDPVFSKPVFKISVIKPTDIMAIKSLAGLTFVDQLDATTVRVQVNGRIAAALKALSVFDIQMFVSEQTNLENEFMEFYEKAHDSDHHLGITAKA